MKIERLELFGYNRLMLANIQKFVYEPHAPMQIILGTNGCGKSSVLWELSPLPAQASQYSKEGSKTVWITHRGIEYVLSSSFKHGNKHSFKRDGEELNPGGTGMVQKDLVQQYFNYTQELHQLLIGDIRFTAMPPMKRREWITRLDANDYTYPLAVYKELKTAARDSQGALKHLKQRLATETQNLRLLEDAEGMEERAHVLHHELNALLTQRTPNLPSLDSIRMRSHGLVQRIEQLAEQILRTRTEPPEGRVYRSLEEASEGVVSIDGEVNTVRAMLDRATTEFSELETVMADFKDGDQINLDNVDEYVAECDREIQRLTPELFTDIPDADIVRRDNEQMLDTAIHLFSSLPDNVDRRFSRDASEAAKHRIREQEVLIQRATVAMSRISAHIGKMKAAKDTTCPSCGYVWREGFSEEELAQNETWYAEHERAIEKCHEQIKREEAYLEEAEVYASLIMQFRGLRNNYPRLEPLWSYILSNNLLLDKPNQQQGLFLTWRRDTETCAQRAEWQRKREHILELVDRQQRMGGAAVFHQRMARLEEEISNYTSALGTMQTQAKDIRQFRDRMLRMTEAGNQLEAAVRDLEQSRDTWIEVLRNRNIDQVVQGHQLELAGIQHRITEKKTLEGLVRDLESSHDEVNAAYVVDALLAKVLSPDEGLIAEQLSNFIGVLVAQLNSVINSIWTYDLKVLSCGIESGDLDYKFPMRADNADHEIPDISMGSKGIKVVVDLAFQLTVMLYMELIDYPLYLDEPGEGFDEQHRINLMNFIKQLFDSGSYSQLFMISHYATSHGAFTNADVVVLDASNIAVPGVHNQYVQLA